MTKSTCYLSDDFSKHDLPSDVIICPESLKNGSQIQTWVADLKKHPKNFATGSLFLLRELELQKSHVLFVNLSEHYYEHESVDCLGNIEILNRELDQSDRYLSKE